MAPSEATAVAALVGHSRAAHTLHPRGIEFAEGRTMHDLMRDYAGKDVFGRLGYAVPVDPKDIAPSDEEVAERRREQLAKRKRKSVRAARKANRGSK